MPVDPFGDEHHTPIMNPSQLTSYTNRTPSPERQRQHSTYQSPERQSVYSPERQQSYQLQDNPYGTHAHLHMPSIDRLAEQPTYSVEHVHHNSYSGYSEPPSYAYEPDYAVDPEAHHDAYFTQPYEPNVEPPAQEDYDLGHYPDGRHQSYDDNAPMLEHEADQGENPFGPDYNPGYEDEPRPTPSPAPIRRWKTVKEVQLFNGNLVLDCPIAPRLLSQVPHAEAPGRDEFTHMRYSAATCDPADFFEERFTLRQKLFAKPRHTELFIVVTMYNEDDFLFARTMSGVFKNIDHMCNRTSSKTWGKDAWKKIVVCVISDGRAKINPRTRAVLAGLGCYQDGIAKQQVNGKDVTAHIYEYTTQVGLEIKGTQVHLKPRAGPPVQMIFCLKEKNQKKINSHRWFFQAFGRILDPNICVLLDAGTKPGRDSIYHLWKAFDVEPMCGGACGEIKVMLSAGKKLLNPLVAGQNFEYKLSNILDKPLESSFGFISVLPGAFSAYRFVALQNDKNGQGPLERYFLGEKMHGANAGIFTANMYLAEDRILCFEIVSKRKCRWLLQYVKSSTGETDVPDRMAEFILQRRRWLNGSFFAAVYAIAHFYEVFRSDHSFLRKLALMIEFVYQTISMIFAWFGIGNFFLVFHILTTYLGDDKLLGTAGKILGIVFEWLYLATLVTCFVLALGNRPGGSNKFYMTMVYFWICIMIYLSFAAIFVTVKSIEETVAETHFTVSMLFTNKTFFSIVVSLGSTWVMWLIASILFLDPWHMFTCSIQYLLLTPTYINVLNIYAFCNTHDITWGTKGDDKAEKLPSAHLKPGGKVDVNIPQDDGDLNAQYEAELGKFAMKPPKEVPNITEEDRQADYYKGFRSAVVLAWVFCNFALGAVVLSAAGLQTFDETSSTDGQNTDTTQNQRSLIYMEVVLWSVAGLSMIKFVGAMWYLVVRAFRGV
ncbi:Chitin synthase [Penicillium taxi]|uniref:chitin synthase I n=1 Tax=Penicillium taxi TaxID=168475 RepID=UPI002545BA9C|nr:chitin synthase I [Penicillium taxi]KAJ5885172.1 Chitin synthase [Penicillium taxi]